MFCSDLVRMGSAYYDSTGVSPEKRKDDLQVLALCTWAFVRAMKRHLSPADEDEEDFRTELLEKLPGPQALKIIRAAHRPNRALQDLSTAIENLPMHFMRKNEVHKAVTIFEGAFLLVFVAILLLLLFVRFTHVFYFRHNLTGR